MSGGDAWIALLAMRLGQVGLQDHRSGLCRYTHAAEGPDAWSCRACTMGAIGDVPHLLLECNGGRPADDPAGTGSQTTDIIHDRRDLLELTAAQWGHEAFAAWKALPQDGKAALLIFGDPAAVIRHADETGWRAGERPSPAKVQALRRIPLEALAVVAAASAFLAASAFKRHAPVPA